MPVGVAVDSMGDVFIADSGNNRVLKVMAAGTQTTVGSGFYGPSGVAVDGSGNVFIADTLNNRIQKVVVSTAAESTVESGLNQPEGVAIDAFGNRFIADILNNRILKITAGNTSVIHSGFSGPWGVGVDFGRLNMYQGTTTPCSETLTLNYI